MLYLKNISFSSVSGCIRARRSLKVFPQSEKTRSLAVLVAGIANSCLAIVAILGSFFLLTFPELQCSLFRQGQRHVLLWLISRVSSLWHTDCCSGAGFGFSSVRQVSRFGSVSHTSPVRSVRFVLMKNRVRVRCVRFGFGSIPISNPKSSVRLSVCL